MFRSIRLGGWKLTVFSLLCLMIFVAVCVVMLRAGGPDTVEIDGEAYSLRAESDADITAFLSLCGYRELTPVSDTEVTVPKTWNDTYKDYNDLQLRQGLDLAPYKGRPARELVYADGDRRIGVLLCGGRIIAAHTCAADGSDMQLLIINKSTKSGGEP